MIQDPDIHLEDTANENIHLEDTANIYLEDTANENVMTAHMKVKIREDTDRKIEDTDRKK